MIAGRTLLVALVVGLAGCGGSTKTVIRTTSPAPSTSSNAAPTTPTTTPTSPLYFRGAVGSAAQRPATLELTGDGTLFVQHVQWTSWGGPVATGSGNAVYHGCTPNCAAAPVHTAVVSVRLSNVRQCGGRSYYAGISLTRSSGRPLGAQFLERSWSPC